MYLCIVGLVNEIILTWKVITVQTNEVVADYPGMITGLLAESDRADMLSVYRSVIVRPDGRTYRPVRERLESRCSTEVLNEERDDHTMWFNKAVLTTWMVWHDCPGVEQEHTCVRGDS